MVPPLEVMERAMVARESQIARHIRIGLIERGQEVPKDIEEAARPSKKSSVVKEVAAKVQGDMVGDHPGNTRPVPPAGAQETGQKVDT